MEQLAEIVRQQSEMLRLMQQQIASMASCASPSSPAVNVPWPAPLNINIDPEEAFRLFKNGWENYIRAAQIDKWPADQEPRKLSILLTAIGTDALKKYNNFTENPDSCEQLFAEIKAKLVPVRNVIYNRFLFNSKAQSQNESFESFFSAISTLLDECDYKEKDEMLRDRIVMGVFDSNLKKEMLKKEKLTLTQAVNMCKAAEAMDIQMKNMTECQKNVAEGASIQKVEENKKMKCKFCGGFHVFRKGVCPAWGKTCSNCEGRNHSAKVCKKKKIQEISQDQSTDCIEPVIKKLINNRNKNLAECSLKYLNNNKWHDINCLLDTAADDCLIGLKNLEQMFGAVYVKNKIRPSNKRLYSFGGHSIDIYGEFDITFKIIIPNKPIRMYKITFQVVHTEHIPLLSCRACTLMGLVQFCKTVRYESNDTTEIIKKYDSIFNGLGRFAGEIDLEVDNKVSPVIQKARRIPVAFRDPLRNELKRLEELGIIQREDNHTDWVSNILIVKKNDESFRICLDPIPLNKAIKRPNYQYTTVDEILPELGKAKIFSTFDVKKGFWHLNLSNESSKLTTFWTPFGKYRWKVLPFGISSSPDYFQMKMAEMVQGLSGVEILVDDILVYGVGDSIEEAIIDHNIKLENLMQRLVNHNCKLNRDKMKLLQTSVKYYGHIFTNNGLQPDPAKVEAILNIPTPENKKHLQRFLGIVTYLSRFIPNLSANSTNLRHLCHENSEWIWTNREDEEFHKLKSLITDVRTLKYFDKNVPLTIECDSSCAALGAAMFQDGRPVAYASRTLTAAECRYAQIEKELLAILFACTRFDQLIVGNKKTIIKTDHRPLLNIFKKPLLHAPKRLQSMLLLLQRYQLELQFVSGKDNILADALSRLYTECEDIEGSKEQKIFVILENINPMEDLPIADSCIEEIKEQSNKDENYTTLRQYILEGWPTKIRDIPDALKYYYSFRDELTVYDNLILKRQTIIIPEKMRSQILTKLHRAHSGVENTLKLARDAVFWPSMSADIKDLIMSCSICAKFLPSQQKLPMQSHAVPEYPFQIVSMDVFFMTENGKQNKYLVTIDHYSDFFELDKLKDLSAKSVIETCKRNFARHGIPEVVCTDGGTNFVCQEFAEFSGKWNFKHVTSSPHHHQGNGKAEATVKIAKKLLMKSNEAKEDTWLGLLCLRNTPNKLNTSPVQRLYSRRTRGTIPMLPILLKPSVIQNVSKDIMKNKERVKHQYDKKARKDATLQIGQPVVVQLQPSVNKHWTPGSIQDVLTDRSYLVKKKDEISLIDPSQLLRPEPVFNDKPLEAFRDYTIDDTDPIRDRVRRTYYDMHTNVTVDLVKQKKDRWLKFNTFKSTIKDALIKLNELVDESDPDTDLPNIVHAFQTAERIRLDHPDDDWFHLTGLVHDLGKVMAFYGEPQWCVVGDTFPVGCKWANSIVYGPESFKDNPDTYNPKYNTEYGMYEPNCGLDKLQISWSHDEYMYQFLKHNKAKIPEKGLYMIRYHSLYPWHAGGDYRHLTNEKDEQILQWVLEFNKYDLYTKSTKVPDIEGLWPYYEKLIEKYIPGVCEW